MADQFTLKSNAVESKFKPHPEGQFAAQCRDFIDLGETVKSFEGKEKLAYKVALVFQSEEYNAEAKEPYSITVEETASMYETANLRKFLEAWRGKSYTEEEVKQGIPADRLAGNWALISVEHRVSAKGRTFANIKSISPLPKAMPRPTLPEYVRAPYWDEKKKSYATAAAAFRAKQGTAPTGGLDEFPEALQDDFEDPDLPFDSGR